MKIDERFGFRPSYNRINKHVYELSICDCPIPSGYHIFIGSFEIDWIYLIYQRLCYCDNIGMRTLREDTIKGATLHNNKSDFLLVMLAHVEYD